MKPHPTTPFESVKSTTRIASFLSAMVLGFSAWGTPTSPPNLIVILTDDQGYHDVGFNGSRDILTPNLDSIASNGVRFTSGYVSTSLSSPSRAGLLTGRYQERFGYERDPQWQPNNPNSGLPLTETTLADTLGQVGYETGMIGKWHLGSSPALHPLKRGFKEFFGFLGAGHRYLPEGLIIEDAQKVKSEYDTWLLWILRNREPVKTTNYLTDEFSDEAVRFIARQKDQPFFLLLAYNTPHDPLEAPDKYINRFPQILGPHRRTYAAMMSAFDDGVGKILAELRKSGLAERTLVVYLSAGGGALEMNSSDSYPLRGAKSSLWEGGWRVPFAMQWPGHLPTGMVYDQPVLSLDIFATIASLANAPINPERPLDGVNLIPYLTGLNHGAPHDAIYLRIPDRSGFAIRSGDYKLVRPTTNQPTELYDLSQDISESKNLADQKPEVVRELEKKYTDWSRRMLPPNALGTTERNEPRPINTDAEELKSQP
jgi:arylsulfatase A-like enzyme